MKPNHYVATLLLCLSLVQFLSSCKKDDDPDDPGVLGPIELECGDFTSDMTLVDDPDRAVDYLVPCQMDVEGDIVVQPGVVIEFATDAGLYVRAGGSFKSVGNSANRITLTGVDKVAGSWSGILFDSGSPNNQLSYTDIHYAGGTAFNSNDDRAAVIIWGAAKAAIDHCEITHAGFNGLAAIYTDSDWSISHTTITQSGDAPAIFLAPYLSAFNGTNDFTGNALDALIIDLATEALTASRTMARENVPYRIRKTFQFFNVLSVESGTLTIEAGTEIEFEDGLGIQIEDNGELIAEGTAVSPITFRGVSNVAGAWLGIYFDATATVNNRIVHARISGPGADWGGDNGGIFMRVDPRLLVDQVMFQDITGCSIHNLDIDTNPNLTATNLTHTNTQGSICHD
ncbi:MAG: hypothetical protein AAF570_13125 [Bacteroidota bacterium]